MDVDVAARDWKAHTMAFGMYRGSMLANRNNLFA